MGIGFERAIEESDYIVHACAILPRHAHLVVARHQRRAEQIVGHLKGRATQQLAADGIHPLAEYRKVDGTVPSPWAQRLWKVFLFHDEDIMRAIDYVERNPLKEGKPEQYWSFVVPFQRSAGQAPPLSENVIPRR